MPWTTSQPPAPARDRSAKEKRACVAAANSVLERTGDEGRAVRACIAAMNRVKKEADMDPTTLPGAKIVKLNEEERTVFGWFSIVEKEGQPVVDLQGHVIPVTELEQAAYDYVLESRRGDEMHVSKGAARLIESVVLTKEKQAAMGLDLGFVGWWGGFHVDDEKVWKRVKAGDLAAFSIGGRAVPEEMD